MSWLGDSGAGDCSAFEGFSESHLRFGSSEILLMVYEILVPEDEVKAFSVFEGWSESSSLASSVESSCGGSLVSSFGGW